MNKSIPVAPQNCDDVPPGTLSVEQALAQIDALITPVEETVTLGLTEALHYVLAEAVASPINVPPHRNSAMDGYAVRAADLSPCRGNHYTGIDGGIAPCAGWSCNLTN